MGDSAHTKFGERAGFDWSFIGSIWGSHRACGIVVKRSVDRALLAELYVRPPCEAQLLRRRPVGHGRVRRRTSESGTTPVARCSTAPARAGWNAPELSCRLTCSNLQVVVPQFHRIGLCDSRPASKNQEPPGSAGEWLLQIDKNFQIKWLEKLFQPEEACTESANSD